MQNPDFPTISDARQQELFDLCFEHVAAMRPNRGWNHCHFPVSGYSEASYVRHVIGTLAKTYAYDERTKMVSFSC